MSETVLIFVVTYTQRKYMDTFLGWDWFVAHYFWKRIAELDKTDLQYVVIED